MRDLVCLAEERAALAEDWRLRGWDDAVASAVYQAWLARSEAMRRRAEGRGTLDEVLEVERAYLRAVAVGLRAFGVASRLLRAMPELASASATARRRESVMAAELEIRSREQQGRLPLEETSR